MSVRPSAICLRTDKMFLLRLKVETLQKVEDLGDQSALGIGRTARFPVPFWFAEISLFDFRESFRPNVPFCPRANIFLGMIMKISLRVSEIFLSGPPNFWLAHKPYTTRILYPVLSDLRRQIAKSFEWHFTRKPAPTFLQNQASRSLFPGSMLAPRFDSSQIQALCPEIRQFPNDRDESGETAIMYL